jgi:biofilm PGA synthesis N-glycosyltransferase PgaC
VRSYQSAGVVLVDQKIRRGKIANLNEIIPTRSEEIVVLSDANVSYHPGAVKELIAGFADECVGCVTGKVILTDTTPDLHASTEQYYSMEWRLQRDSSALYSMVGADGAMYALRRELFQPCPNDTLIEDLVIPMHVVAMGKRVVFEPKAIAWEKGVESIPEEWRRKVRIAAGAAQGLMRGNVWPKNAPGRFWFIFVSHKLLRWLSPVVGIFILGAAILSWKSSAFAKATLGIAAILALLALVRLITGWRSAVFSVPFYFLFGQAAIAVGMVKGALGNQSVLWTKIDR